MLSIAKFNQLGGKDVSRADLIELKNLASKEQEFSVYNRVSALLDKYPDADIFTIELDQPINISLAAPSIKDLEVFELDGTFQYVLNGEKAATINKKGLITWHKKGLGSQIREKIRTKAHQGLGAPRHSGVAKDGLDECGRLIKGYKYNYKGEVVKVAPKKAKSTPGETKTNELPKSTILKPSTEKNKPTKPMKTQNFEKKSFAPEEWQEADTRKTTYLLKKYIKEKYGVTAKVKTDYYSGGSSMRIEYNFGPDDKEVEREMKRLQYGRFDGMTDMYNYSDKATTGIILDGYKLNDYKFVFVDRAMTEEFLMKIASLVSKEHKFADIPEFDGTKEGYWKNFDKMFGPYWNWQQLIRSKFYNVNFATENENEIKNIEVKGDYNDFYLTYEYKGKKYDSREPVIYPTNMVKEKNIVKNMIKFFDYGANEVAVIGYVGEIKEDLENIGGEFSSSIKFEGKNNEGYIFHKRFADEVANLLIAYSQENQSTGLGAPFHSGIAKEALDNCSRLKKGYIFNKGGGISKSNSKKSKDQKANYDKELASDNWKKYSKTYQEKSKVKTPFNATLVDTPKHNGYTMFIYRKKGNNSKSNFFFPMINGERLSTKNFALKREAVELGKTWINNHIEKKKEKPITSKSQKAIIDNLPLSKITLDTNRFQNRSKLNATIVKNIVENFNETELDPLIVWKSKNKVYLLAGHHRYEGLTQLKKKVAPVKYFSGTEAEAIEFAKVKSNSNRSLETPLERAKIYREMATKKAKSIVESEAKRIEGKNANYILNIAALNTKGEVINAIESLAETTDKQNATLVEKIADWTGQARRNYDQLTNAHEREMFLFLMDKEASKRITTKAEFLQKIFAIVGAFDFEAKQPLNLKRFKFQTEGEKVYNSEYNDLKQTLENKLTEKANLLDRLSNPTNPNFIPATDVLTSELAAKKLVSLNQEIGVHQKKLMELSQNKGKYTKSGDNQIGLFSPAIIPYQIEQSHVNGIPSELISFSQTIKENENLSRKPNRLMQMHFDSLDMDEGWEELMQNPAKNMKIAIWGPPKNGKTAGALQLANYLTKFGSVLYNFADQGFNKSTQDLWKDSGLSENSKAEPTDISTSADLEKEIAKGNYDFVFIDMISDFIRTEKMKPEEFKERFMKRFPNVSFILIFEVTKGGNFKGDQGWTHLVDAIMTVEDFLIENRGRYGTGHKVIWEEGFKKFNPKKYDELIEETPEADEISISTEVESI